MACLGKVDSKPSTKSKLQSYGTQNSMIHSDTQCWSVKEKNQEVTVNKQKESSSRFLSTVFHQNKMSDIAV